MSDDCTAAAMRRDDFSLQFFRDAFVVGYQNKYPDAQCNYVALIDEIIAMK